MEESTRIKCHEMRDNCYYPHIKIDKSTDSNGEINIKLYTVARYKSDNGVYYDVFINDRLTSSEDELSNDLMESLPRFYDYVWESVLKTSSDEEFLGEPSEYQISDKEYSEGRYLYRKAKSIKHN